MVYCQPAPVAHPMVCNCAPSYGCGQYGCYKLKAQASKNMRLSSLDNGQQRLNGLQLPLEKSSKLIPLEPFRLGKTVSLKVMDERRALAMASPTAAELPMKGRTFQDPNEAFLECCMDRHLPDACLNKCNFNYYNQHAVCFILILILK
ncbi:unnamed protein product [Cercopithifilaria johnstoni]|uniref:Domain of unknown function DB domain-containing protein n=1 Tax=Cercopithifilaria johnstoni TaxID=2874296 RepID=A0A8J2LWD5_9BILA|nr:unnamed protein product [Cercopithifilaria johnstoni]